MSFSAVILSWGAMSVDIECKLNELLCAWSADAGALTANGELMSMAAKSSTQRLFTARLY